MARKTDTDSQAFLLAMLQAMEARLSAQGRAGLPLLDPPGYIPPGTFGKRLKAWRAMRAEEADDSDGTERAAAHLRPRRRR
ncbi:MAG: hypothetical protein QM599_11670 [Pseudoxanthomonas sp.]